jgi:lysophospholipase L1-like esterase
VKRRSRKDLLVGISLAIAGPLLLLAGIEAATRILDLETGFFLGPAEHNCMQRSALLEVELRPNCEGDLRGTKLRTNSLGLRGDEVREDGSTRILAIGDSCTWGWRVAQDESYPAVLQRLLDERYGAGTHQVINAGVPGYSSYRGLLYLRERGLSLDPAIVIVGYGFNDMSGGGDDEVRIAQNRLLLPLLRVDDFLIEHLGIYRWTRWQMSIADSRSRNWAKRVPPDKYEHNLGEIIRLAREHGAKVMLINFTELRRPGPYKTALFGVAEKLDVPLLLYQGPKFDLVHPTAPGYRAFVPRIIERMEEEGWLSAQGGDQVRRPRIQAGGGS